MVNSGLLSNARSSGKCFEGAHLESIRTVVDRFDDKPVGAFIHLDKVVDALVANEVNTDVQL